jgi:prepilin-type N-terminal cleavage/methylation domain-containing protein
MKEVILLNNKGFTLIELIIVISIVSIISLIAIPSYIGFVEKAKEEVCKVNCRQLKKMYELHLTIDRLDHSDLGII